MTDEKSPRGSDESRSADLDQEESSLLEEDISGDENGNDDGLTPAERKVLSILKRDHMRRTGWLAHTLEISSRDVIETARAMYHKGYAIEINEKDGIVALSPEGQTLPGFIPIEHAAGHFKILVLAEPRIGSNQEQLPLIHWIYDNIVDAEDVKLVVLLGGSVVGRPTPTTYMDIHKHKPSDQVNWFVEHWPRRKSVKTYLVPGRREATWLAAKGFDAARTICSRRDDLVWAGSFERTFDIRGIRVKVMTPWDDNAPIGKSYGIQKNVENINDDPFPDFVIYGGVHVSQDMPAYHGAHVYSVPSLHTTMTRQKNRSVKPRIGAFMLEFFFDAEWNLERSRGHHINLNFPELISDSAHLESFSDVDVSSLEQCISDPEERTQALAILEELFQFSGGRSRGDLSRKLRKSRTIIEARFKQLEMCGFRFDFPKHTKHVVLQRVEKESFAAPKVKPSSIFQWKTRDASISDTHFGSKLDLPELVQLAYEEAARAGVRRIQHSGDHSEGSGGGGYRGHHHDVKMTRSDDMEDYEFAVWPRVSVPVNPDEPPVLQTKLVQGDDGSLRYKSRRVRKGTFTLQTDFCDGNHDGWDNTTIGHARGRALAFRLPDHVRYLGSQSGECVVDGVFYRLLHPRGGLGYTLSTKLEKKFGPAMRALGKHRELPKVLKGGNYHVAYAILDEDLDLEWVACYKFPEGDEFHETLGLVSQIGMWITERYAHPSGKWSRVVREYRNHFPQAQEIMEKRKK